MEFSTLISESENTQACDRIAIKILELETVVKRCGVHLEFLSDFAEFRKTAQDIPEKGEVTAVYDHRCCEIGPNNGFWIKGSDQNGRVIHLQAMRLDDLSGTTLAQHWIDKPHLFAPPGHEIDLERSSFVTAPASHTITGNVCYHGDLWLDQEYRNLDVSHLLSKLGILIGLSKFSPDFIYGLITPKMVERGWAARAGYLHVHPWAPRWQIMDEQRYYDDYLVWVRGDEMNDLWTTRERDIDILSRVYVTNNSKSTILHLETGQ